MRVVRGAESGMAWDGKRLLDLGSNGGSWKVAHLRNAPPGALRERQGPGACATRRPA